MEKNMNYFWMTSLEYRALTKIAITLWNQDDIRALTANFDFTFIYTTIKQQEWLLIEDKVIKKAQELPLPDILKKKVQCFIKPIGFEITKWRCYHHRFLSSGVDAKFVTDVKLFWTQQGTVDRKKTAQELIKDKNLDIATRYKLACIYCLKSDIWTLWNQMPEKCRKSFYNEPYQAFIYLEELVFFWTCYVKGDMDMMERRIRVRSRHHMCTHYQYAFETAAENGNKVAAEYFLQQLNSEEREQSLLYYAIYLMPRNITCLSAFVEDYPGVLFFLISQMNKQQRLEVFKMYPLEVLKCLLHWPWQDFFMETAKGISASLSKRHFYLVLKAIVKQVMIGFKDYNYQKLFREFLKQSPITLKEFATHESANGLLLNLFQIKDIETIKLIFKDLTIQDKENVIFSDQGKLICEKLIDNEEINLLEFFVQECISTKDVMIKFKKDFEEYIMHRQTMEKIEKEKDVWSKISQFLNNLAKKYNKRACVEEGNDCPTKRLCS